MNGYKEFEAKTLDEAIHDACAYFDTSREKLEVEILNDSKGGIFGLVGAKKARIRARMVQLSSVLEGLDAPGKGKQQKKKCEPSPEGGRNNGKREAREETPKKERDDAPRKNRVEDGRKRPEKSMQPVPDETEYFGQESVAELFAKSSAPRPKQRQREPGEQKGRRGRKENGKPGQGESQAENGALDADLDAEDLNRIPFDQLDQTELETAAREIVARLTEPFLGTVTIGVTIGSDRIKISVTNVEDPGLLIGRDGQTLASLQYLVTRMLSNRMKTLLRVQIDAGDYRERQDERLRELALSLAEKVKAGGRPQVTRPLSSYHRRVIHLTLQDDPLIQTHSKGEGELKRVMVARKKQ